MELDGIGRSMALKQSHPCLFVAWAIAAMGWPETAGAKSRLEPILFVPSEILQRAMWLANAFQQALGTQIQVSGLDCLQQGSGTLQVILLKQTTHFSTVTVICVVFIPPCV